MRTAFLDRGRAIAELTERAQQLLASDVRVIAVGLFGSLARGDALPSSDADVLIVLSHHAATRWFDRIPEYAESFSGTSLPVEPFPYTVDELRSLSTRPGFARTILRETIPLGGDERVWQELKGSATSAPG